MNEKLSCRESWLNYIETFGLEGDLLYDFVKNHPGLSETAMDHLIETDEELRELLEYRISDMNDASNGPSKLEQWRQRSRARK